MRCAVDGTDSGSNFAGLSASSCSRPSIGAHVHTSASKIGCWPCLIETRIDSARLVKRSVVTSRITSSKVATPRKWPVMLTGRPNCECSPAARNAIAATYPPLGPQISQSRDNLAE